MTRLNADQFYMSQSSGLCQAMRLKFDLAEPTTSAHNVVASEFNGERSVPYRLTPALAEFVTGAGISGPFATSQIAVLTILNRKVKSRQKTPRQS